MKTKYIVFGAEDSFSDLFWDDDGCGIGDAESFYIGEKEYQLSELEGLEAWYMQADKYDPYTDAVQFTTEGMEEWINQGYRYAKQLRKILPKDIELYYAYRHCFGDGKWVFCRAYITL